MDSPLVPRHGTGTCPDLAAAQPRRPLTCAEPGVMADCGACAGRSMCGRAPGRGSAKPGRRSSRPLRAPSGPGRPSQRRRRHFRQDGLHVHIKRLLLPPAGSSPAAGPAPCWTESPPPGTGCVRVPGVPGTRRVSFPRPAAGTSTGRRHWPGHIASRGARHRTVQAGRRPSRKCAPARREHQCRASMCGYPRLADGSGVAGSRRAGWAGGFR